MVFGSPLEGGGGTKQWLYWLPGAVQAPQPWSVRLLVCTRSRKLGACTLPGGSGSTKMMVGRSPGGVGSKKLWFGGFWRLPKSVGLREQVVWRPPGSVGSRKQVVWRPPGRSGTTKKGSNTTPVVFFVALATPRNRLEWPGNLISGTPQTIQFLHDY